MSTRTLDQCGRVGAFHKMVRRKAALNDSGLSSMEIRSKCLDLPLSGEGVFGKGLQELLKQRKEQRDQLRDLIPDFGFKRPQTQKRKMPTAATSTSQASGSGYSQAKYPKSSANPPFRGRGRGYSQNRQSDFRQRPADFKPKPDGLAAFRPPKRD